MKHHQYLTLNKVLATFAKERNSPKETEVLKEVLDCQREYLSGTTSQPTEQKIESDSN